MFEDILSVSAAGKYGIRIESWDTLSGSKSIWHEPNLDKPAVSGQPEIGSADAQ
jgi:hypothetical protein